MCPGEQHPRIAGILETVLYVADIDRAERFYFEVVNPPRLELHDRLECDVERTRGDD